MPDQNHIGPTELVRLDDAAKYFAARLRERLGDSAPEVRAAIDMAAGFGDPDRYSDGRFVESTVDITPAGNGTVHYVWFPDPTAEQPTASVAELADDADGLPRGWFEVSTDPTTQTLRAVLVRL